MPHTIVFMPRRVCLALVGLLLLAGCGSGEIPLPKKFTESASFTFSYPQDWMFAIPQPNMLLLANEETLTTRRPGPSITILRSPGMIAEGGLAEALDVYLQRGPLNPEESWTMQGEITPITFDNRQALRVDFEGRALESAPMQRMRVTATTSSTGIIYIIAASTPLNVADRNWPIIEAVLETIHIQE